MLPPFHSRPLPSTTPSPTSACTWLAASGKPEVGRITVNFNKHKFLGNYTLLYNMQISVAKGFVYTKRPRSRNLWPRLFGQNAGEIQLTLVWLMKRTERITHVWRTSLSGDAGQVEKQLAIAVARIAELLAVGICTTAPIVLYASPLAWIAAHLVEQSTLALTPQLADQAWYHGESQMRSEELRNGIAYKEFLPLDILEVNLIHQMSCHYIPSRRHVVKGSSKHEWMSRIQPLI